MQAERPKEGTRHMRSSLTMMMTMALLYTPRMWSEPEQQYLGDVLDARDKNRLHLAPGITVGTTIETEASFTQQGDEDASDLALATFELSLEAALRPGVTGKASLLWEEDETEPIDLDTGYIELGGTAAMPFVLSAGRMYLPYGGFNSFLISDPLTLELGETRETALALAHETEWYHAWVGAFAGELESAGGIENAVAAIDFTPLEWLSVGASWTTDIGEGVGHVGELNETLSADGAYTSTQGVSLHLLLEIAPISVAIESLGAIEDLAVRDANGAETVTRPEAWHIDVAYAASDAWTCALRYEGAREFKPEEMPEHQWGLGVSWQANRFMTVGIEYLYGTFSPSDVDDRHMATTQLAVAF